MPIIPKKKGKVKKKITPKQEFLRRSKAAKKGWETRKKRNVLSDDKTKSTILSDDKIKRSEAAKKGWETRRKKKRQGIKREREAKKRRSQKHPETSSLESEIRKLQRKLEKERKEKLNLLKKVRRRDKKLYQALKREYERDKILIDKVTEEIRQRFAAFELATADMEYTVESKIITRVYEHLWDGEKLWEFDEYVARDVFNEFEDDYDDLTISDIYEIWFYGEMK